MRVATPRIFMVGLLLLLGLTAQSGRSSEAADVATSVESPLLVTPSISADPKLGRTVGGLAAYIRRLDPGSTESIAGVVVNYSDTDSLLAGLFADTYWSADRHRLSMGVGLGNIKNEYADFLGSGLRVRTVDNLKGVFIRYRTRVATGWYVGGQFIYSNYLIDFPPRDAPSSVVDGLGLLGFESAGIGLVTEYDSRDVIRNPVSGTHFSLQHVAYREAIGGNDNFDTARTHIRHYRKIDALFGGEPTLPAAVLALEAAGRFTNDAPISGYSSVTLPGYTRGNYLGRHYSHLRFDLRMPVSKRWGLVTFGGIGCLYGDGGSCNDNFYPSFGLGVSWLVKPKAGIILRAEAAKGENDNSAFYLRFGHPF